MINNVRQDRHDRNQRLSKLEDEQDPKEDQQQEEGDDEHDLFDQAAKDESHEAKSDYQESFANSEIDGVHEEAKSTDDGPLYYETSESATPEKV